MRVVGFLCFFSFSLMGNTDYFVDVMQVAHHYFENGIAYFTKRINRCISICELSLFDTQYLLSNRKFCSLR
jgi:hypothetical protein